MEALVAQLPLPTKVQGFGLDLDTRTWKWEWRVRKWEDFAFQYGIMALYYISIVVVQWHVNKSKAKTGGKYALPFWFKPVNLAHNLGLCFLSVWLCYAQVSTLYTRGKFDSLSSMLCMEVPMEGYYGLSAMIFILSKVWEWVDTYFLIMMGKKVIFLHWFHHMTTLHAFITMSNTPSGIWCWMNAAVHVLMYAHYAFPQRWARSLITSSQLVQFFIGIGIHVYVILASCFDWRGKGLHYEMAATLVITSVFLVEFMKFFYKNYMSPKPKRKVLRKDE